MENNKPTEIKKEFVYIDGRADYEADVKARPNYPDGTKRPSWDNLRTIAQFSWNRKY